MASFRDWLDGVEKRLNRRQKLVLWLMALAVMLLALFYGPQVQVFCLQLTGLLFLLGVLLAAGLVLLPLVLFLWAAEVDLPTKIIACYLLWFLIMFLAHFPFAEAGRFWMFLFFGPQILFFSSAVFVATLSLSAFFALLSVWGSFCTLLRWLGLLSRESFYRFAPWGRYGGGQIFWHYGGFVIFLAVWLMSLFYPDLNWFALLSDRTGHLS
jgi:hypothetical protein